MYTYLKFGLPRVFPPSRGLRDGSSGYNSSDDGSPGPIKGNRPIRTRSEIDFRNLQMHSSYSRVWHFPRDTLCSGKWSAIICVFGKTSSLRRVATVECQIVRPISSQWVLTVTIIPHDPEGPCQVWRGATDRPNLGLPNTEKVSTIWEVQPWWSHPFTGESVTVQGERGRSRGTWSRYEVRPFHFPGRWQTNEEPRKQVPTSL